MADVATQTIDIENAGETVSIRRPGDTYYDVTIRGDAEAEYEFDINYRDIDTWFQDEGGDYSGRADYDGIEESDALFVRIRCSKGTGTAGDQAEIRLIAGNEQIGLNNPTNA